MTDTRQMLQEHCEEIAAELKRLKDNYFFYPEDEQDGTEEKNYFDDCLDIKYILDSDKELFAVHVYVAWGGPNIYIDTWDDCVKGYWGADTVEVPLGYGVAGAIDDYFREYCYFD